MAEEEEAAEGEEEGTPEGPKGSRMNQFIILAAVVLLCQSALAYVLVTRFVIPKQRAMLGLDTEETATAATAEREKVAIKVPLVYTMGELLVNPTDETALRYLNTIISLEVDAEEVLLELADKIVAAQVRALVFRTLGSVPVEDMATSEDRLALKELLKTKINESELITTGEVTEILFERFIVH